MKKILWMAVLTSGLLISWACNGPAPYSPGGAGGRNNQGGYYPVPSTTPTVALTLTPAPFVAAWQVDAPNAMTEGNGFIYVAEADGSSVSQVQLFNNSTYAPVTQWTGDGNKSFQFPDGVAVSPSGTGNVYVLDEGNSNGQGAAVYELGQTSSAVGVSSWGGYGSTAFGDPSGIALDSSGNVYVSDIGNGAIYEFGSGGATAGEWSHGNFEPAAIALDSSNNIYVVDAGNWVVWKLTGGISGTATSFPILASSPNDPFYGLSVDSAGNIYVAVYSPGSNSSNSGNIPGLVEVLNSSGTIIGEMNGNAGGATPFVGPDALLLYNNLIFVADYDANSTGNIQVFTNTF
jgi:hypothetical protein